MLASWDGESLELWDETGVRQAVIESIVDKESPAVSDGADETAQEGIAQEETAQEETAQEETAQEETAQEQIATRQDNVPNHWSALDMSGVKAHASILLLPVEILLQRSFSLPVEHPRFVDGAVLGQELDDQAGVTPDDWWLCWQTARAKEGVRGLMLALPQILKEQLSDATISRNCGRIYPDISLRLQACLAPETVTCAVLDADSSGLMLGFMEEGVWRGMRRLNLHNSHTKNDKKAMADNALRSLQAMGFDAALMPVSGHLDVGFSEVFSGLAQDIGDAWDVEIQDELLSRHAANAAAFSSVHTDLPFNFRHGRWALQSDWKKSVTPWKRAAALGAFLALLIMGHDVYRVQQLAGQQQVLRQGIEDTFHQALPGVAMLDPMLQLKQAAGGGANGDAWFFLKQLQAISQLQSKESGLLVQRIQYSGKEMLLSGTVADFAVANRVRDALSAILQRKVELVDTDLNGKQVRIRLRWS